MRGSLKVGRFAGIEIGIHYTWLFAFVLFAWLFAQGTFPAVFPDWSTAEYWVSGIVVSVMIFISVLIHELSHSLMAIKRGMKVSSIVFFIFGGVSNIENEPDKAWDEFIMAVVGPLSSVVLGGIFLGIYYLIAPTSEIVTPVIGVIFYLGVINLLLAAFNIIPGFPLDGGRVFRSIIWGITKNLSLATLVAGNVGRLIGWAMILLGIALILGIDVWIFQGSLIGGIWMIFIGWFLSSTADNAMREQATYQQLTGVRVKDVMDRYPECVTPNATVDRIVQDSFIQRGRRALPICNESGLLGIVTLADIRKLPQDQWANTTVEAVMTRSPLDAVDENESLNAALRAMAQKDLNQVPVMGDGQMVGLLSRADVIRYLQTRRELGLDQSRKPGER